MKRNYDKENDMKKQEVSSFWYAPKNKSNIGLMELLSIKSFLDNGYKFILYTYNLDDQIFVKLNEIFDNFELKDANEVVLFKNYFSDDRGGGVAAFSDYFRYYMLYNGKGEVWVDLDMICLNYVELNQEYIFSQEIDDDETKPRITTSFLKFPKNSEFGKNLILNAENIIDQRKKIPWGIIGPWFLAEQVKKYNLENFAWNYKKTCQIPWCKTKDFLDEKRSIDSNQPFIHLFSETWNCQYMNKNHFHKSGIYSNLLEKHKINDLIKQLNFKFSFKDKYHIFVKHTTKNLL